MKRIIGTVLLIAASFVLGFAFKTITTNPNNKMKKVTGIGGIFLNAKTRRK